MLRCKEVEEVEEVEAVDFRKVTKVPPVQLRLLRDPQILSIRCPVLR
jgi:hypothetical protein